MEFILKASTDFVSYKYRREFFFCMFEIFHDVLGIAGPTPFTPEVNISEDYFNSLFFVFLLEAIMHCTVLLFTSKATFDVNIPKTGEKFTTRVHYFNLVSTADAF